MQDKTRSPRLRRGGGGGLPDSQQPRVGEHQEVGNDGQHQPTFRRHGQ